MSVSTPTLDPSQQQQSPPLEIYQQAYSSHSGPSSVGPVIGVLALITVLGAIAVMIGRLCSGRKIMGHGQYDFESWAETKCASCIDGRVDPPPPRTVVEHRVSSSSADARRHSAEAPPPEVRDEEGNENNRHERAQS